MNIINVSHEDWEALPRVASRFNTIEVTYAEFKENELTLMHEQLNEEHLIAHERNACYQEAIGKGCRILLAMGIFPFDFLDRSVSDKFIADFQSINARLGNPFTGIVFFEQGGGTSEEYIYVFQQLKSVYGQSFSIMFRRTSPWVERLGGNEGVEITYLQ